MPHHRRLHASTAYRPCQPHGQPWRQPQRELRRSWMRRRAASDDEPRGGTAGEDQQSHGEADGREAVSRAERRLRISTKDRSRHIEVSGARSARCQSSSGSALRLRSSDADPCADLSADPVADPSATDRCQRIQGGAMPIGKQFEPPSTRTGASRRTSCSASRRTSSSASRSASKKRSALTAAEKPPASC
jgi:hypothetical protein